MPSEHDKRRWTVEYATRAVGNTYCSVELSPVEMPHVGETLVPLATKQRVRELEEDMEAAVSARNAGDYKEGYAAGHATVLQRVAELERELRQVGDVSDGYRLALGEDEALLAKAREALRTSARRLHDLSDDPEHLRDAFAVCSNYACVEARTVLAEITTASKNKKSPKQ